MTIEALERLMQEPEGEHLEFKEAKNELSKSNVRKYLCALANRGGGHFIIGVTDERPRQVVGTQVFPKINAELNDLRENLRPSPTIQAFEVPHPDGRVLVFRVGARPRGQVVRYDKIAWARVGESLTGLPDEDMRAILLEDIDTSAEPCEKATLGDLDPDAVEVFRDGIVVKTINEDQKRRYASMPLEVLLRDTGLLTREGMLTRAALLLMGDEAALRDWMPNAEIIFEYRTNPKAIRFDRRETFRRALLLAVDDLWSIIQAYAFQNPLEVVERTRVSHIPRFGERSIREVLLNAVTHRDYHNEESVIIRMSPDHFVVTSPGPLPATITPENIAREQHRRNRRLAEALEKCGRIERSGQGVDMMVQAAIQRAQPLPLFEEPEGRSVRVTLFGDSDPVAFPIMQRIPIAIWDELDADALQALDAVRHGVSRQEVPQGVARKLIELDIIEPSGPGDAPYTFSTSLRKGDVSDAAFLTPSHILVTLQNYPGGASLTDLVKALPDVSVSDLRRNLQWLRRNEFIYATGHGRGSRWHLL